MRETPSGRKPDACARPSIISFIETNGQGLVEITDPILRWVTAQRIATGLLTIWCRHTSASLLVQENADPDVRADLVAFFRRVAPENAPYRHTAEGPDDMPAHIKAALTQTQLTIPIEHGRAGTRRVARRFMCSSTAPPHTAVNSFCT